MKRLLIAAAAAALATGGVTAAMAQPMDHKGGGDHHFVKHDEWRKGGKIRTEDWGRGQQVDYRAHHLRNPPNGYEWREVDGNYVLAAVTTGVILDILANQ
jgi:Ni/Co efflux regulator RcnB